jgi:hypothetical protein
VADVFLPVLMMINLLMLTMNARIVLHLAHLAQAQPLTVLVAWMDLNLMRKPILVALSEENQVAVTDV